MASKQADRKSSLAVAKPPQVFYRINSLLYTLRTIAQREDQLCVLMHHLRTSGRLNSGMQAELREILEEIPTEEYLHDLRALEQVLDAEEGQTEQTASRKSKGRTGVKRKAA